MTLNTNASEIAQIHYELTVEGYDREGFYDEEITEVAKGTDSMKSHGIILG